MKWMIDPRTNRLTNVRFDSSSIHFVFSLLKIYIYIYIYVYKQNARNLVELIFEKKVKKFAGK